MKNIEHPLIDQLPVYNPQRYGKIACSEIPVLNLRFTDPSGDDQFQRGEN